MKYFFKDYFWVNNFPVLFPEHEYPGYQTNYDQTYQDLAAYNTGYDQNSLTSAYTSVTEKQDELDMDVSKQWTYSELRNKRACSFSFF